MDPKPSDPLLLAKAHADALRLDSAPRILAAIEQARDAQPFIRAEVSNAKKRIEDAEAEMEHEPDAERREELVKGVYQELDSLDGWVHPRPVDPERIAAVIERDLGTLED